jgi:hypothetical protein
MEVLNSGEAPARDYGRFSDLQMGKKVRKLRYCKAKRIEGQGEIGSGRKLRIELETKLQWRHSGEKSAQPGGAN